MQHWWDFLQSRAHLSWDHLLKQLSVICTTTLKIKNFSTHADFRFQVPARKPVKFSFYAHTPLRKALVVASCCFFLQARLGINVKDSKWSPIQMSNKLRCTSFIFLFPAGFVDLQTEKADLLENVGAIPFLDYKHFAAKIFFPEVQWSLTRQHTYIADKAGDVTVAPFISLPRVSL